MYDSALLTVICDGANLALLGLVTYKCKSANSKFAWWQEIYLLWNIQCAWIWLLDQSKYFL